MFTSTGGWGWWRTEEHTRVCTRPRPAHVRTRLALDKALKEAIIHIPSPPPPPRSVAGNPFPRWGSREGGLEREDSWDRMP